MCRTHLSPWFLEWFLFQLDTQHSPRAIHSSRASSLHCVTSAISCILTIFLCPSYILHTIFLCRASGKPAKPDCGQGTARHGAPDAPNHWVCVPLASRDTATSATPRVLPLSRRLSAPQEGQTWDIITFITSGTSLLVKIYSLVLSCINNSFEYTYN